MQELAYIPFYILYILEWLFWTMRKKNFKQGYYSISFEREAYENQKNRNYLNNRKCWAWIDYFKI